MVILQKQGPPVGRTGLKPTIDQPRSDALPVEILQERGVKYLSRLCVAGSVLKIQAANAGETLHADLGSGLGVQRRAILQIAPRVLSSRLRNQNRMRRNCK
jgi:hypothetical protein